MRRQSTFPSATRQSILPPAAAAARDTRPVRNPAFQTACRENIEQFCRNQRCPVPINDRVLQSPTQKDFHNIFKWLISDFLDPYYPWVAKNTGDDIIAILKDLRYPGLDNISKTALGAPGSGTNWGTLLAMLNWVVDLAKAHGMWEDPNVVGDPLLGEASSLPVDHPLLEDRLLWEYVSKMYDQWFRGDVEEFPEAVAELQEAYGELSVYKKFG